MLRQMSELELFQLLHRLWNSAPVSVKYVGNITTFSHKLKHTCLYLLILLNSPAHQSKCNNWNCLSIINCLTPFVLVHCILLCILYLLQLCKAKRHEILRLSLSELVEKLQSGELKAVDVLHAYQWQVCVCVCVDS